MDSQANNDLKRVVDMAAESVAKCQRLNYNPSPYPVVSMTQNVPPSNHQYPTHNNQYGPHASGTNAVTPLSQQSHIANTEPVMFP